MSDFELRILNDVLQYRTKDVWYDGSTTENGRRTWSKWKDVPVVREEKLNE